MLGHLSSLLTTPFGIVVERLSKAAISSVSGEFGQDICLVFLGLLVSPLCLWVSILSNE